MFNYGDKVEYSCIDQRYLIKDFFWVDSLAVESLLSTCEWNSEDWSQQPSDFACVLARCPDFPDPPAASLMNRTSHWNVSYVTLGTDVEYSCFEDHYFDGQSIPINRTIYLTCDFADGIIHAPATWPTCITSTPCPSGPQAPPAGVEQTWQTGDDTNYLDFSVYKCSDYRDLMQVPGIPALQETLESTCQWDQTWNKDSVISGLTCHKSRCNIPPDKIPTNNLLNDWDGTNVELGSTITYSCPSQNYFAHDRSQSIIGLQCDAVTGDYHEPASWPTCIEDINCGVSEDAPGDVGTKTYLGGAIDGQVNYDTTISYTCGDGRQFADGRDEIIVTCQWDGNWSETLPGCNSKYILL